MFRVIACLTGEHDWRLVVLAGIVCLLTSLVAVSLFHRARLARGPARMAWLSLTGAAAGCGIWATHFIAMLAYQPSIAVTFNTALTVLSLAAAILSTLIGLVVATDALVRWSGAVGGAIVGAGIACMHYTGMRALEMPGYLVWDTDYVLASIGLGIVFAGAAFAVAARFPGWGGTAGAASLLTLAITSHHFTAMSAVQIASDPRGDFGGGGLSPGMLAVVVAGGTIAFLGMSLVAAIADRRLAARSRQEIVEDSQKQLRRQNGCLDAALNNMTQGLCMFDANEQVVVFNRRFLEMYKLSPQVVKPGCTFSELLRHRKDVGLMQADPEDFYLQVMSSIGQNKAEYWASKTTEGRYIQAFTQPLLGGGWITTHEDVTEQRCAEEQVREQKLQLDMALDNMSQGLLMFDAEARLMLCNRRYLEMYDLSAEDVRPGTPLERLLELRKSKGTFGRDPQQYIAELKAALTEGKPITQVADLTDGRIIAVANRPMTGGRWVSAHEDITEQRRVEERLRGQKVQLDTALNNMKQGLNMFDASGRLVVCNERYLEMYRLLPDGVRPGSTVEDMVQARIAAGTFFDVDADQYTAELKQAMARCEPTETIMELTDGRVIAVISQPTSDGNGWVVWHEDITDRRRAEEERDRSQAFATTVIENVPTTIVVKDAKELRYRLINRAGEQYFGIPRGSMIGKHAAEVFPKDLAETIIENDRELLATGAPQFFDEHPVTTPGGDRRIITSTRMPIRDHQGQTQYLLTVVDDRTHRKRAEAQIAHMAHHDALTGLPNRAASNICLDSMIETAAEEDLSFSLMCVDVDRFKEINDVYGYAAGDAVLRELAKRLQAAVGGAFLARLDGDEFIIISTDGEQPAGAEALADRVLASVSHDFALDRLTMRPGISVGIAVFPVDGSDAATLFANANAALYRAKAEGRGSFRFFKADMDERLRERRVLQQELQSAIERHELSLHYQPQAQIDGVITGFEALVRWQHPQRGMIPPGTFIPLAEESGFIVSMGEWIMREACRQAASWSGPLSIAINLSPVQFRHGDLPTLVHSVLLETGLAPSRLEFEITEGVLIGDFTRAVSILRRLKALGVRIAMDDFGTGYSSLSYLQSFPFDKIKIDRAFISNLEQSPQSATIIRAVIGLARGLDLPVVAEGVETKEQLAFLAKEACDEIQGFLIGRPMPIDHYAQVTGQSGKKKHVGAAAS
jgi:diguanylate cyclase (GGDEF)-like protein/PAS domain S-box-containing protein